MFIPLISNLHISKHSFMILGLVMPLSAGLKSSQSIPEEFPECFPIFQNPFEGVDTGAGHGIPADS